jgi:hypothetical protein
VEGSSYRLIEGHLPAETDKNHAHHKSGLPVSWRLYYIYATIPFPIFRIKATFHRWRGYRFMHTVFWIKQRVYSNWWRWEMTDNKIKLLNILYSSRVTGRTSEAPFPTDGLFLQRDSTGFWGPSSLPRNFPSGAKKPQRKAGHSPPYTVKVKNA